MNYQNLRRLFTLILWLGCLGISGQSFAQGGARFSAEEKRIIELQDKRIGLDEIAKYLSSPNEKTAWRAAIALGNIGDTLSRPPLVKQLLKEKRPVVCDGIAFSLGVLGVNNLSVQSIIDKSTESKNLSAEFAIAIARTIPKDRLNNAVSLFKSALSKNPTQESYKAVSAALVELGLRKLLTDEAAELIESLEENHDPSVRWQAIYALARTNDSTFLDQHIGIMKSYLSDLGSAESRMFAASALGSLHNQDAGRLLLAAARSELDWRVRVNIFRALGRQSYFSSGIFDVIKKAIAESNMDTLTTIHVAITALETLEAMIVNGTLNSSDSTAVIEYLAGFDVYNSIHDDLPLPVRAYTMVPAALFGDRCIEAPNIGGYVSFHDRRSEIYSNQAIGNYPDTIAMYSFLIRLARNEGVVSDLLDGLHRQWLRAVRDTAYMRILTETHYLEPYRHLLIRLANQTDKIEAVGTTMEYLAEPNVLVDSFRSEAKTYLLGYLKKFDLRDHSDQLAAVLQTVAKLKLASDSIELQLRKIYADAAGTFHNRYVANLAYTALDSIGVKNVKKLPVDIIRDSIDWLALEQCPDTLLVPTKYGTMFIKPLPYDAPLSVLNILKLARMQFFSINTIHRLVPNFVIQTGDITATGYGGPGYSIRTEISPMRYDEAGICGMASDGKDTEGSQWFITHCPTPHLNTRYTIWGKVVKGVDVLDKLQFQGQIDNIIPYK